MLSGNQPDLDPVDIIRHKRDGRVLTSAEIASFVQKTVAGAVSDAQIASFLMAVFQRGLDRDELAALTEAMRSSGETFDWSGLGATTVDKHSTGGVGDKTSLLLAPIVAAAGLSAPLATGVPGVCVPMISGRSLGHTGGTLDKLECIPGFHTQLSVAAIEVVLRRAGAALVGQSPSLVPADRILYALRDHTGTVESPYLISASIMSKKLAEDLDALVLDVKTGSGAFMRSEADARQLAQLLTETGAASGTRTVAFLTRMDEPLGRYAGNWLEVLECVDILQGRRHALSGDLLELTLALAGSMLHLGGMSPSPEAGRQLADRLLMDGRAYRAWLEIVRAQGGDTSIFEHPETFHQPGASHTLCAEADGYLSVADCFDVGMAVQRLGAGRAAPGEPVSAHAGLEVHAKTGDRVHRGQPLVTLFADREALLAGPLDLLRSNYKVGAVRPEPRPLILDLIAGVSADTVPSTSPQTGAAAKD